MEKEPKYVELYKWFFFPIDTYFVLCLNSIKTVDNEKKNQKHKLNIQLLRIFQFKFLNLQNNVINTTAVILKQDHFRAAQDDFG